MRPFAVLLLLTTLTGCDKLTGAADQQIADAEAIGFACRVSLKPPEDCMKENDTYSPSYILDGWKLADADIKAGKLDPSMRGSKPSMTAAEETDPAQAATQTDAPPAQAEQPPAGSQPEAAPAGS